MNLRFIDWIWHVRGSLPLEPGQGADDAFARLAPLFREANTSHKRQGDTLAYHKQDPLAQDRMAVFENGTLRVEQGPQGRVLRYHLVSRALLMCFLAPLLFLAFAQLTIVAGQWSKPAAEAVKKEAGKDKDKVLPQNPIDKWLGAPAPELPKKDAKGKDARGRDKFSPTPAYVFAGIFAFLYVVGRLLEARLVRNLFRHRLNAGDSAWTQPADADLAGLARG